MYRVYFDMLAINHIEEMVTVLSDASMAEKVFAHVNIDIYIHIYIYIYPSLTNIVWWTS